MTLTLTLTPTLALALTLTQLLPNLYHGISTLDGWPGGEFDDGEALEGSKWEAWWLGLGLGRGCAP